MEETNTTSPRPVMDIQPQRAAVPPVERPVVDSLASRPETVTPTPVASEPSSPAPLVSPTPESSPEPISQPSVPSPTTPITDMKMPSKHKAPIAAIIIAVLVAAALIGLSVYVYLRTQNTVVPDSNQNASQQESAATGADVDSASQAVDEELNSANDSTDFNSSDLTDETLGL